MMGLSRGHTIARPPDLCDNELDALLGRMTGHAPPRPPWPVFGYGFGHAAGLTPVLGGRDLDLEIETRQVAERPEGFEDYGRGHREFGERYRAGEEQLAHGGRDRGEEVDLHEAVIAGSAIMEIHENIAWALDRAGLDREALGPIGHVRPHLDPERVAHVLNDVLPIAQGFIGELPTRDATLRLRLLRHQNPSTKWKANDLNDIAYVACAVVHCDIVVTERTWVHELGRSGLLEEHGTTALHDGAKLPETLVAAVR